MRGAADMRGAAGMRGVLSSARATQATLALSYALAANRTLVARANDTWWLVDAARCPARAWACLLRPLSPCSEPAGEWESAPRLSARLAAAELASGGASADAPRVVALDWRAQSTVLLHPAIRKAVPRRLRRRGLLWFRAHLAAFVFRPAQAVQDALQVMSLHPTRAPARRLPLRRCRIDRAE
jgi:hypothetical protein